MKKIGIVGGVAWQSTDHYYSELCRRSERWHLAANLPSVPSTPEISIESLDLAVAISYLGSDGNEQSWSRFDQYHRAALMRLEMSGVDFAIIASNSAHHRFDPIVRGLRIPVISIVEEMARKSALIGARRVLLLGTDLTMTSLRFGQVFAKYGVEAAGPADETVRALAIELVADMQHGRGAGASDRLVQIARRCFDSQFAHPPIVCLACTELPLAFEAMKTLSVFECDDIVFINSTMVHIDAAFEFAVGHRRNHETSWRT